jgi:hypothetical protein
MNKDLYELALNLGLSESVLRKYRQIGLLDDMIKVVQKGKVRHLKIDDNIQKRIKGIQQLQKNGFNLKTIMHKLVPISIYELSVSNGSGQHHFEKRIYFTLMMSDKIETIYFKDEPQEISQEEMKEMRDLMIEAGKYNLAEKMKFTPKEFTFLFEDFESTILDQTFLKRQKLLRSIQDKVKPSQWLSRDKGKVVFNEMYESKQQYESYNQCIHYKPVIRYQGIDKYAIRYDIGFRFIDSICFTDQYSYIKERLIKMYKKRMKELNILDTEEEFTSYTIANIVSDKESKILNIIREKEYKTIEVIKRDGSVMHIKARTSQYNTKDKKVVKALLDKDYKKIEVNTKDGKSFYITEEDSYIV